MIDIVHRIARREGLGDLFAEGTRQGSPRDWARGSEHFAMQVKGLELPAYDCQGHQDDRPWVL